MKHEPFPKRKNNRLKNFDYSLSGGYFITILSKNKRHIFGEIVDLKMCLNEKGNIARMQLLELENRFDCVQLDEFIVMPNHIHAIIFLMGEGECASASIPTIVGSYKPKVTKLTHLFFRNDEVVWTRSYFDHIIRNEDELFQIRKYIIENPFKWDIRMNF